MKNVKGYGENLLFNTDTMIVICECMACLDSNQMQLFRRFKPRALECDRRFIEFKSSLLHISCIARKFYLLRYPDAPLFDTFNVRKTGCACACSNGF